MMEEAFSSLSEFLNDQWNFDVQNKNSLLILEETYNFWYKITYENYQEYFITSFTNHNLIVIILALIDLLVNF